MKKWVQSDHDKENKFDRWFYGEEGQEEFLGSVTRVTDLQGNPLDEWLWDIFGEYDEQSIPEDMFNPYQDSDYAKTFEGAKKWVEILTNLDRR